MTLGVSMIALIVRDYDEAIAYYTKVLGLPLIEDTQRSETKRWVVIEAGAINLLLAKAKNEQEAARIGDQTGGRVFLFIDTDDFDADYARLKSAGVDFIGAPRKETFGKVVVFRDLYGNQWDLVERDA
jgi:catechol 2,3-dioxygenase-like lactoylglutathione lyase family enzyme